MNNVIGKTKCPACKKEVMFNDFEAEALGNHIGIGFICPICEMLFVGRIYLNSLDQVKKVGEVKGVPVRQFHKLALDRNGR